MHRCPVRRGHCGQDLEGRDPRRAAQRVPHVGADLRTAGATALRTARAHTAGLGKRLGQGPPAWRQAARVCARGADLRVRSHDRFALLLTHFILLLDPLRESAPLFLKRQRDRTLADLRKGSGGVRASLAVVGAEVRGIEDLGSGRIIASEIVAPNMFVNMV